MNRSDQRGPHLRSDIVDVYVFRARTETKSEHGAIELLQLRRDPAQTSYLGGTWHPIMGHVEDQERAVETAWREVREEVGLVPGEICGAWALEQVHPFFLAQKDEIILSPRFAMEVAATWEPSLNPEHDAFRWIRLDQVREAFMWPGQLAAIEELRTFILPEESPARARLALQIPGALFEEDGSDGPE